MDKQEKYLAALVDEATRIVKKEQIDLSCFNQMLSRQSLISFAHWKKDKAYTRVCLYEDHEFELVLICWQPLSRTAIHNHNKQNCYVFFFDSDFEEAIYCEEGKEELEINSVQKGGVSSIKEMNICHSLKNLSNKPAMSLHLYNSPIKTCKIVRSSDKEACLEWAELTYDSKFSNN